MSRLPFDLRTLVWLPGDRLLYSTGVFDTSGFTCNYWQLRLAPGTGVPASAPQALTSWSGFCLINVGATADGKELVFQKTTSHRSVFVSDYDSRAVRISTPKHLTDQEAPEFPTAWTPDGEAVIFASSRNHNWEIYKQRPGQEKPQRLTLVLPAVADQTPVTPDGLFLVNVSPAPDRPSGPANIFRIPLSGGAGESILAANVFAVRCSLPPARICVLGEETPSHRNSSSANLIRAGVGAASWCELTGRTQRLSTIGPFLRMEIQSLSQSSSTQGSASFL
jgi:hypothetical protein